MQAVAGTLSGTALGYIAAGIPGAFVGARMGYNAATASENLPQNSPNMAYSTPARRRLFGTPRSGRSRTGSSLFATPRSYVTNRSRGYLRRRVTRRRYRIRKRKSRYGKRKYGKSKMKRYRKKYKKSVNYDKSRILGYQIKEETYGAVTDEHCVYIKHSTNYVDQICRTVMGAIFRKLFKKAGYEIGDNSIILSGFGPDSSTGAAVYRVVFTYHDPTAEVITDTAYTLASGETLRTLVDNFSAMKTVFLSCLINGIQADPHTVSLQAVDTGPISNTYNTISNLLLENEIMNLKISSVLRVQNRTSVTTSTATDVNDNQPLMGKLLTFRHGDPRTRYAKYYPTGAVSATDVEINGIAAGGVEEVGASELYSDWQEPPNMDKFNNCVSSKKVIIGVGETQQCSFAWTMKSVFKNGWRKLRPMRAYNSVADIQKVAGVAGKCQMLCLEELIRTQSDQPIKVGYEREIVIGCWFKTKPPVPFSPEFRVTP